jgi:hypothetical protein
LAICSRCKRGKRGKKGKGKDEEGVSLLRDYLKTHRKKWTHAEPRRRGGIEGFAPRLRVTHLHFAVFHASFIIDPSSFLSPEIHDDRKP